MNMTGSEIGEHRLCNQFITNRQNQNHVVQNLCGLQAQYEKEALRSLSLRITETSIQCASLVKCWTLRGTIHMIHETDLPVFLHTGSLSRYAGEQWGACSSIPMDRKIFFADLILEALQEGNCTRDELKKKCNEKGMSETESRTYFFNPWGGIIRYLVETGRICYLVGNKSPTYAPAPPFTPLGHDAAWEIITDRYFSTFGPATMRDASYFLGKSQQFIQKHMATDGLKTTQCGEKTYFYKNDAAGKGMPACILLPAFDPLLMAFFKEDSPFFERENIRNIYSLTGIVYPTVMVRGRIIARWKQRGGKIHIAPFKPLPAKEKSLIGKSIEDRGVEDVVWEEGHR
jgi:hypothetical protein